MSVRALKSRPVGEPWRLRVEERPLRAEPFSEDRLSQHARELAGLLASTEAKRSDRRFLERFSENAAFLRSAVRTIAAAARDGLSHRREVEWLLDNFYIVEEQLREIRDDLPRRYYHELAKTDSGEPRVYVMALELITHTDSVLDEETIVRFVSEFQTVAALSMGELWAVPIMLRLVLTENLRRIAAQILSSHASEVKATQLIEQWSEGTAFPLELDPIHEHGALLFHVIEKLQQQGAAYLERFRELERRLAVHDLTVQQSIHLEHQRQASSQVSIGNVITSMRLISTVDWVAFFERTSLVEQILRKDPAEVYPRMDFESRDRYRHVIEDLTDGCELSETDVAESVINAAQNSSREELPTNHIGYWLIDGGRPSLEAALEYRPKVISQISRWFRSHPTLTYLGGILLFTLCGLAIGNAILRAHNVSLGWLWLIVLITILPMSDVAVGVINIIVTTWLRPRLLPKFDLSAGIPIDCRTVVVVPSMLSSHEEADALVQRLETHFLANPDPALCFALLTDLPDAVAEELPGDAPLIEYTCESIRALNRKHFEDEPGPFFLFHRRRQWNEKERSWMGWERKRGKLMEFNHLLRGQTDTSYVVLEGALRRLYGTEDGHELRYLITLDADTTLPHNVARKLIATLSHPLNCAVFEINSDRIRSGYAVLQPRVTANLASAQRSRFSKIFANNPGIDPYSTSASDVYQDLFGEGSFTGKGIYHIDAFERCLHGAFPENQILSHDLIEGCHARVGLVSDIEVFDNYPPQYEADAKRLHRWVRGDWQISPWLLPVVPAADGWRFNRLAILSKWKVIDNLRRSLVPPALIVFLVMGWLCLPEVAWWFTLVGLLVQAFPLIANLKSAILGWTPNLTPADYLRIVARDFKKSALQTAITTALLPHKAWTMIDAIARTMTRMLISRHKLLEWETASDVERRMAKTSNRHILPWMILPLLTVSLAGVLQPPALSYAWPFLLLWLVSPLIVNWLGQKPVVRTPMTLTDNERQRLRREARKIWAFFEAYVGPHGHWLPPDNMQEYPEEKVAHRISPTNEGLYLVSGLVARDFGYLSLHSLTELWDRNLFQWKQLERLDGHFYNWYDTTTLAPLVPRYLSTVDSGNLVACYLTLQRGIEDLRNTPVLGQTLADGLHDTVEMIVQTGKLLHLGDDRRVHEPWNQFLVAMNRLKSLDKKSPANLLEWQERIGIWHSLRAEIASRVEPLATSLHGSHREVLSQIRMLLEWLDTVPKETTALFPWLPVIREGLEHDGSHDGKGVRLAWEKDVPGLDACWHALWKILTSTQSLVQVREVSNQASPALDAFRNCLRKKEISQEMAQTSASQALAWADRLSEALRDGSLAAEQLDQRLLSICEQIGELIRETDFSKLYNPQRKLFSIGYNLEDARLDSSHYDMLCSEARVASFLAIAKGDIEAKHWFRLGRQLTYTAGQLSLLSWGGTMFEYMMPHLFQTNYEDSLLTHSCRAAVARQREYGQQRGVPWGISECGFGALAANSDYHYRSFGVPGLGLKRGLSKDLVISPYSTLLALEIDPHAALANLNALEHEGGMGPWGFYEAVDYTAERVPAGKRSIIVRSHMTHHHGMSLLAIANLLLGARIRHRFHDHAIVRATELLLQERVPVVMPRLEPHVDELANVSLVQPEEEMVSRRIIGIGSAAPRIQLLSNSQYSVMISSTGGGYSQHGEQLVTRWRSDPTRDHWGQFIYLCDVKSGRFWSATYQPTCVVPARYEVIYSIDKAEFIRRDGDIETHLEIAVSPENNAEMRQLKITNNGDTERDIEVTSYVEILLTDAAADIAHPAFQKLFVETEYVPEKTALFAKRRPRETRAAEVWGVHALSAGSEIISTVQFETSRQQFLGRGRTTERPLALEPGINLTGASGAVLDPIFSLRCHVTIPPHGSVTLAFITAAVASRDEALSLTDQYHDPRGVQRAFELAWAYAQVELRHLQLSTAKMHLYQRLASAMLYPDSARRPSGDRLLENHQGQRGLWRYGISGDRPLLLVYVTKSDHLDLARDALGAYLHWKGRGLRTELAIVNNFPGSYFDAVQDQLIGLLQDMQIRLDDKPAEVFLLRGAQMPPEDKTLLEAAASMVLYGDRGSLARQTETAVVSRPKKQPVQVYPQSAKPKSSEKVLPLESVAGHRANREAGTALRHGTIATKDLEFWNGFGGFAHQGREYHIRFSQARMTPMPWSNVIANPQFGCLLTESGGGYTWFGNSRENKLTSWANDPISDPPSEILYIADCDSGAVTSPFVSAVNDSAEYWVQHGQGYSRYLHTSMQLSQEVFVAIAADESVKFVILTMRNERRQPRRLSVTYYVEWVLGVSRSATQMHVSTSFDERSGALLATNPYHSEQPDQVAFLWVSGESRSVCGDRTEFLGRNGRLEQPAALGKSPLSGRTGAGLDPCGAVQSYYHLGAGEEIEVVFLLGAAANPADARKLLDRFSKPSEIRKSIDAAVEQWNDILETVEIKTPDRAFDLLVNRWLLYQTLSCRVWGRSAYYQSGGAYGFRDQLQDVMSLVYSRPDLARRHILVTAARQFEEGDVQHWWHPPEGRGTRTRFSDDLLWLPFVVCQYITVTCDETILDEQVSFLQSPPLDEHQQERYELPSVSPQRASIYNHCQRAISHGFRTGPHGIPLMGCGDWNDGMNKVGESGRGESVWVGWFLLAILERFLPVMERRGDASLASELKARAEALRHAMEENAWDGDWYRRAYFDDGTPLGSTKNEECQIDSLAQTWAVIAKGDPTRSREAVESVMRHLVKWRDGMVLLFTPPFNESHLDPGYIKGYVPGTRENGGQYTHAVAWLVEALTMLHDGDRALQVFDLINPIHHSATRLGALRYQVEPYVIAADVYSAKQHLGRGGWTWYTGSAAWLYRVALEDILGLQVHGNSIRFCPRIPKTWATFELRYRRGAKEWSFRISRDESNVDRADHINPPAAKTTTAGEEVVLGDENQSEEIHMILPTDWDAPPVEIKRLPFDAMPRLESPRFDLNNHRSAENGSPSNPPVDDVNQTSSLMQ